MTTRPTSALLRPGGPSLSRGLGIGLGLAAILTVAKWLVGGVVGPFHLYFLAVLAATWYGGLRAGLITTVLTALIADLLFVPPIFTLLHKPTSTLLFCFESTIIALVTDSLQVERRRTARAASDARGTLHKLEAVMRGVDEGITVQDPSGRVIYANEVAARLSGFASPAAFLAASGPDLTARVEMYDERGRALPPAELPGRVALAGGAGGEKLIRFRLPGSPDDRWSLVRANPVRDESGQVVMAVNIFRDVTEQRRQEEALRLGREWLSTALSSIADAVVTTEPGGAITFLNPAAAALTGWRGEDAHGKSLREVLPVGEQGQLPRRDGTLLVVEESSAPIRATDGAVVGSVHVFRDVSSKRREEARRAYLVAASEELNSSLDVETTLATVARRAVPAFADWCAVDLLDGDQRKRLAIAHVDPSKVAFVAELERKYPSDPASGGGVAAILRSGEPMFTSEIPPAAFEAVARDAEHLRLLRELDLRSFIGVPIKRGGRILGAISYAMAESNRRYEPADLALASSLADRAAVAIDNALLYREAQRARQEAGAERDRLAALIMAAPTAIAVIRVPELVFELQNEPYRQRLGGVDLVGTKVSDLDIEPGRREALRQVLDTGEPVSRIAQPIVGSGTRGQETRYVTYTVQPLRDATGKMDRVVLFTSDVTDEVLARQRIEAARAQAEQASRAKDEFLAMLGHELRNPLAPIQTALELMRMHAAGQMERERAVIERQVKHLVRLVDDLLDVSRIARGKVELAKEVVELAEIVADAIEIASPLLEERQHVLVAEVPRQGLAVHGDRVRLAQVVSNLVHNAAKYSQPGGRITISAAAAEGVVTLRVRDNGIGISAAMLPRVFDLFVQEQQSIDRSHGGLGLGLTIVKNLVGLHGGRVTAHSDGVGRGSEFAVELPLAGQRASAVRPAVSVEVVAPMSLPRVLIVDDNEDAAEMLALVLGARGYPIRVAHDGPSALAAAAELRPEVALVDIGLPVMDGFEVARRLRGLSELSGLRLIAVTGYGQETDRQKSRAAGFDHHLVKPIDVKTVLKIIEAR